MDNYTYQRQTKDGVVIGRMLNNWRRCTVTIYETDDPTKVRAVGVSFDDSTNVVDVIEDKELYRRAINMYPRMYVYD